MIAPKEKAVVVVLSGGLDSAVLAYSLKHQGYEIRLVYVDYGKAVSTKEKAAAKLFALFLNAPIEIIDVSGLTALQLGYVHYYSGGGSDELDVK